MKKLKIAYSVVSRGTERYNNRGYIAVSEKIGNYKYILNIDHGKEDGFAGNDSLKLKSYFQIENIAFSRFQLITALMYKKHKFDIKDNIVIFGLGNIGISCLFYLLDNNYKNITIFVRNKTKIINDLVLIVKENYNLNIEIITALEKTLLCNTFIDTTGSSNIIEFILENIDYNKTLIILSTPREETYYISPLMINRKNITLIGGHEINGIDGKYRNKIFNSLLKNNDNKIYLNKFVNIYNYSTKQLNKIKNCKKNFIEILKY